MASSPLSKKIAGCGGNWRALEKLDANADDTAIIDRIVRREPTPEFAAEVAEECNLLLARLTDDTLKRVAIWKMEGYSNHEIAQRLEVAERTVERKLNLIRALWERESPIQ